MNKHVFLRPLLGLAICTVCLLGLGRASAPAEQDMPPEQQLWFWQGGTQLNRNAFEGMVSEVIDYMPIVPYRSDLVHLLSETAATESSFGYAVSDRRGKTLGVYQILLSTGEFVMARLEQHPHVLDIVQGYMDPDMNLAENLTYNLHFQTAMAVAYYWLRAGDDLLERISSLDSRAKLYKLEWNTPRGRATEAKYRRDRQRYLVSTR